MADARGVSSGRRCSPHGGTAALILLLVATGCTKADIKGSGAGGAAGGTGGDLGSGTGGTTDGTGGDLGMDASPSGVGGDRGPPDGGDAPAGTGGVVSGSGGAAGGHGGAGIGGGGGTGARGTGGAILGSGGVVGSGGAAAGTGGEPDGGPGTDDSGTDGGGAVAPSSGDLVITEIMVDSDAVTDDFGEWLEVHNPSATQTFDLFGCTIADTSHIDVISRHVEVPPGAFVTLARFADATGGFVPDYAYPTVKFGNTGDSATLRCSAMVDRVDFTTGFTITKGRSLSLAPDHYNAADNDVPANWCLGKTIYHTVGSTSDYGSPGLTNPSCP